MECIKGNDGFNSIEQQSNKQNNKLMKAKGKYIEKDKGFSDKKNILTSEQATKYEELLNKFNTITIERSEYTKSMKEYKIKANEIDNDIKQIKLEITKSNEQISTIH